MKILIIGGGIAGLCAGVYARKSGFETEIVEMNSVSGGLATSWKRNDYTFENCLHWLVGSKRGSSWNDLWKEVFPVQDLKFVDHSEYVRIETEDGQELSISTDISQLEQYLLKRSPEDALPIKRMIRGIKRLQKCELVLPNESRWHTFVQTLKMLPFFPELQYWSRLTAADFSRQFKSPLLQQFVNGGGLGEMSSIAVIFALAWMANGDAGYPIGGSRAVIQKIEDEFRRLGGILSFKTKVNGILTVDGKAIGVRTQDGRELMADWIISAADGFSTLFDWIPEEFRDVSATAPYGSLPTFPSYLQVSFGIKRNLSALPGFFTRVLSTPVPIDPETEARQLSFRVFHYDPTFSRPGTTAVTCSIPSFNTDYWVKLQKNDPEEYRHQKKKVADFVAEVLERRVPGVRADIEEVDIATPSTVVRYTGNWKGSMEGFLITPDVGFRPFSLKLPRLDKFRMVGQWVMPRGGLPSGIMTGRLCIQDICKTEHREFGPGVVPVRKSGSTA